MAIIPWNQLVGIWSSQSYPWVGGDPFIGPPLEGSGIILSSAEFAADGRIVPLPGSIETILTWQISTASGDNAGVRLLGSTDGINFEQLDQMIVLDIKTITTGVKFIQAILVANPTLTLVTVRVKVTL